MSTEAQIEANRQNALKSTGPQTPEGKAASSQNAARHGLRSTKVLIPSDDPAEYEALRSALMEELKPVGPSETLLADRIAALNWQLQRAVAMQSEVLVALDKKLYNWDYSDKEKWEEGEDQAAATRRCFAETLGLVVLHDFTTTRALERLEAYERRIENSLHRTRRELEILQDRRLNIGPIREKLQKTQQTLMAAHKERDNIQKKFNNVQAQLNTMMTLTNEPNSWPVPRDQNGRPLEHITLEEAARRRANTFVSKY